jgi:hypothetical protein
MSFALLIIVYIFARGLSSADGRVLYWSNGQFMLQSDPVLYSDAQQSGLIQSGLIRFLRLPALNISERTSHKVNATTVKFGRLSFQAHGCIFSFPVKAGHRIHEHLRVWVVWIFVYFPRHAYFHHIASITNYLYFDDKVN